MPRARLCTAMLVRRMVQLQKHLAPVISNSFCLSRQYSSGPDVREFMGKGLTALGEIERLSPYTDFNDIRLRPLLKTAKESFELALEVDKDNVVAMLWLARLHLYYNIPGACLRSGANLLETAAESGLADAQYELACRIRSEAALLGDGDAMDDRTFKYLESAACQKHAGALFLVGTMYLSGKHVRRDSKAAAWCFRKAAEQGYIPASTVYASLVSKGANWEEQNTAGDHDDKDTEQGMELRKSSAQQETEKPLELSAAAQFHFDKAAEAGDPLALEWLKRVPHAKEPENLRVS
uniref:Uncharacterized protein n=1 Tax=Physcomitrium patens TaxID=3218 RepID=A0A7I4FES2_PHYPA|nr:uncharacterized protein LOC112274132 isoform X2 [Physcomitrium patens]|eukprot:XP_024359110.1 uncharacterized protein LOC112274132 isoform X2 [Physcomitrella patens]